MHLELKPDNFWTPKAKWTELKTQNRHGISHKTREFSIGITQGYTSIWGVCIPKFPEMCSFRGPISHICTDEVDIRSRWVGLLIVGAKWNKSRPLSNLNTVIRSAAILPLGLTRNSNVKLMQSTLECRKIFRPTAAVPTKKLSVEIALPTLGTVLADRKITQLLLPPPRRLCNRRCLSVCLSIC